ncbi:MAG: DeoR/GlpR transcriptional regulator [Spirochaetaceae bacterium]|nr:MAG: DeoR/GlpR transcriptional regulator [Spirochaetaceae bacterium]
MIPFVRHQRIIEQLNQKPVVYISELLNCLEGVSESTIRRDLRSLSEDGQIVLLHGGAATLATTGSSYDMPIERKQQLFMQEKRAIARYAASLVLPDEVIYVDSGTTLFEMVPFLKPKEIQVVTSNTAILAELRDARFRCIILGGEVTETLGSVTGPITDNMLRTMYFDKAFLGATGFSESSGFSTPDFREASKKQIVAHNSQQVYVLADSSKAGRRALCKFLEINEAVVVCDQAHPILVEHAEYRVAQVDPDA